MQALTNSDQSDPMQPPKYEIFAKYEICAGLWQIK